MLALAAAAVLAVQGTCASTSTIDAEVAAVIDRFYDLEFDAAMAGAEKLAADFPGHPVGPFYRSIVYYQKFLAEEPKSEETLEHFRQSSEEAVAAADALEKKDPAQGHYYTGIARGFRARVLAAQKRYFKAVPEAMRSVKHLKKAVELDPGLEDAYLGLGMYHYFTARIPAGAKPFAYLIGAGWGDREKGLEYLHRTAEKGGPARMEARSMLSSVYALEGQWDKAEAYLRELAAKYRRNPLYRMRLVYVLARQKRWKDVLVEADPKGAWLSRVPETLRGVALRPAVYRSAEALLMLGRAAEAEKLLAQLPARSGNGLQDYVKLRQANLMDLSGHRDQAVAAYRSITHPEARKLADEWIERPFPAGPKDAIMPWLGLETPR